MDHLTAIHILILMVTAIVAGVVDTIAGGGGLMTVPMMLVVGLPPAMALGTNRLQSCFGEFTACLRFARSRELNLHRLTAAFIYTVIGAAVGTLLIQIMHPSHLRKIIACFILVIFIYTVVSQYFHIKETQPRLRFSTYGVIFGLGIGFYNGFFGPATGSLWVVTLMFFLALNIKEAVMHAKPLNFIGNLVSLLCFALGGHVNYMVGILMGAGQIMGASLGAHLVIKGGVRLVKPFFMVVVTVMMVVTFYQAF